MYTHEGVNNRAIDRLNSLFNDGFRDTVHLIDVTEFDNRFGNVKDE